MRGLQHDLRGLRDGTDEERIAHAGPLRAKACGNELRVGLGIGEFRALALEERLRELACLGVAIGAVAQLLKFQAKRGDAFEVALQADIAWRCVALVGEVSLDLSDQVEAQVQKMPRAVPRRWPLRRLVGSSFLPKMFCALATNVSDNDA